MNTLDLLGCGSEIRLRAARRVAVCAGHRYRAVGEGESVVETVHAARPDVLLCDWNHDARPTLDVLDAIADLEVSPRVVLLADPSPPTDFQDLLHRPWFEVLLATRSPWFMDELGATLAKLAGGALFGLERCLPADVKIHQHTISSSVEKTDVLDRIVHFMDALGVRGRVLARLLAIADELFTNAVYDAPVGPNGPLYRDWPRTQRVNLAPDARPTIRFGSDGRVFGISATDPFGSLSAAELRRYLGKGLRRGADQLDQKAGGAGLGLFFLYDAATSFCVNRAAGQRTEIIISLDLRGSYRDVLRSHKSYAVFDRGGP
jgi:CheY-like chemotaxis protein